jgi:dTDP-glucose 4,6-dehydratase
MKVLITGGAGFQGSHIAEQCLRDGHDVTILNTFSEEAKRETERFRGDVSTVWGSVTDPEIVKKTLRGQDVVIHLAARINVDESIAAPSSFLHTNLTGTYNVLEGVREQACRLIYASSCEVYGSVGPTPAGEESALRPHSPYAASKAAADLLCSAYRKTYGIDVTILRPCNIFGPRQKSGSGGAVIPIFVHRALAGKPLVVYGVGEQRREYMYVDDLVAAYKLVLDRTDLQGEVINVASGESPSIREIAEYIGERLNAPLEYGPSRPGEVMAFELDSGKAVRLGFSPKVSFWKGLRKYMRWAEAALVSSPGRQ